MAEKPRVVVAMSGGVDSSVAAALLVNQGYRVTGMMLRLWSEEGHEDQNRCCTPDALAQARRVAAILGIPFYALDARDSFRDIVVEEFLSGYRRGLTPNPCVFCNRFIRWGYLLDQAHEAGAEFMATGHYARIERGSEGKARLFKGRDEKKDQSYVLSILTQAQLAQTLLPLSEYTKPEIRELARRYHLPVAERPDSQDLCFLGDEDYRGFLTRYAPEVIHPGAIVTREGRVLGEHQGLAFYTIGQRKGLGLASAVPFYVLEKDIKENRLVVGLESELGQTELLARQVNWSAGEVPTRSIEVEVKIRYKANLVKARVTPLPGEQARVSFDHPVRDITPGQLVVFYDQELVLGCGWIV